MSYKDILKKYWGYDDFRGIQQNIIESIGEGRDCLLYTSPSPRDLSTSRMPSSA